MSSHNTVKTIVNIAVATAALLSFMLPPNTAAAVSGSDWQAGNIIDDSVFTDKNSMSVSQIQSFLDARIGQCDTTGAGRSELGGGTRAQYGAANGNPAPFTCLNGYYEVPKTAPGPEIPASNYGNVPIPNGAVSAAQLIWNASQTYNISPAVLLVKLATESAGPLTSDTWPFKKQYLYAMGARCPDSGPGGSANCDSNYAGFSIQILESAKLLRGYLDNMTQSWWSYKKPYQNNYILWNVVERGCGGSNVYIQNKATAALYTYTPYQPNQAALNNLYGTGDNCSAYGNRNFWRVFNDWFGYLNKPLVRTENSAALFYTDGTNKHPVHSMDIVNEYGLGVNDVRFVTQAYLDSKPTSQVPFNYLMKSNSDSDADGGNLYIVSQGKRHLVTSMDQLATFGLTSTAITLLPYSDVAILPLAGNLSNFVTKPDGATFRVINGKKSAIFQSSLLNSLNPSGYTSKLSNFVIAKIAPTTPSISNYVALVDNSTGKVWVSTGDNWSYVPSMDVLSCYNIGSTVRFSPSEVIIGTETDQASCVARTSTGDEYLLNKTHKYELDSSWGLTAKNVVSDTIATSKTTHPASSQTLKAPNGELYILKDGYKRYVTSMNALSDNSISTSSFTSVSAASISGIPNGARLYQDGTVLKNSQSGELYAVSKDTLIYISSMSVFNAYGFKQDRIVNLPKATLDMFNIESSPLKALANFSGTIYLANTTSRLSIPASRLADYTGAVTPPNYSVRLLENITTGVTATRYIKASNSAQLYVMENGTKRPVYSWDRYVDLGGTNNNITVISSGVINLIPTGSAY